MSAPVFPPDRYGRRRSRRATPRWLMPTLVAGVVVVGLAVAAQLYDTYGNDGVELRVLRYAIVSDSQVRIEAEVSGSRDQDLVCALRSRSRDGREVGRAEFTVPAGDGVVTRTVTLTTTARAVSGESSGCTAR